MRRETARRVTRPRQEMWLVNHPDANFTAACARLYHFPGTESSKGITRGSEPSGIVSALNR
jgi:hypothetical protein